MSMYDFRMHSETKCLLCKSSGNLLYKDLSDELFSSPKKWSFAQCTNENCRLIWLTPRPIEEDLGMAYINYYTHHNQEKLSLIKKIFQAAQNAYHHKIFGYELKSSQKWQRFLLPLVYLHPLGIDTVNGNVMFLRNNPGKKKLLEVGCGTGEALKKMAEKGWEVYGIDFDQKAVNQAILNGIAAEYGTLNSQNFEKNSFDAVYLSHVLEHVPEPRSFLSECYRVMKQNSKLVIITPNTNSLGHILYKSSWRGLEPPRHLFIFNDINIEALLKEIGFTKIQVKTSGRSAYYILQMSRFLSSHNELLIKSRNNKFRLIDKLIGLVFQIIESLCIKFDKHLGEEIILICSK